jgi:rhomboid family GlyGly-CTERM serine protease
MKSHLQLAAKDNRSLEILGFVVLLVVLNLPLLSGGFAASLAFLPRAVVAGQWWRVLTHPFVHVSWYHLLLDGIAFLLLYADLKESNRWLRAGYLCASGAASLLVSMCFWPRIHTSGLCGLSGIDHGLMAVSSLEMMTVKQSRHYGVLLFVCVAGKCIIEAFTGQVMLASVHSGMIGQPVAVCHAGGVLGGLLYWRAIHRRAI